MILPAQYAMKIWVEIRSQRSDVKVICLSYGVSVDRLLTTAFIVIFLVKPPVFAEKSDRMMGKLGV